MNTEFEEVILNCSVCGKKMKFIKRKDRIAEPLICQRCAKTEIAGD